MVSIQLLSEQTIAQIAAGEVVERPASVVKELVENALDAGATSIHVAIANGGRKLIRISDNGTGMMAEEATLAIAQHATSKLRTIDDLSRLDTLGFRGEALSSIASVSQMMLTTRHRDEPMGTQIRIEGGEIVQQQPTGAPVGTVIGVENLFYNTPARLKFLKKESTEKRHITALVTRYAMAYPDVRFILEQDGREVFRTLGSGQLADVIARAMGLDNFKQMIEVVGDDGIRGSPAQVAGYTAAPEYHRADRTQISLFVNGRWIQDSSLTYAVVQAYHGILPEGRYPVTVLMIRVHPEDVDVNVHPTKAEVRFRDQNGVFEAVQRAVRQAIIAQGSTGPRMGGLPSHYKEARGWNGQNTQFDLHSGLSDFDEQQNEDGRTNLSNVDPTAIPEGPGGPLKPRTLPMLRVVGQVGAMYIVAEGPAGMYLIDQHAAHQRVLYDRCINAASIEAHVFEGHAHTLDLNAKYMQQVESQADLLSRFGFALEPFGPGTVVVRSIPAMLTQHDPVEVAAELVKVLVNQPEEGQIAALIARYGAVRSGQVIKQDEMQSIVRELERCQNPLVSPEDRATLVHLSGEQLAREFRRA